MGWGGGWPWNQSTDRIWNWNELEFSPSSLPFLSPSPFPYCQNPPYSFFDQEERGVFEQVGFVGSLLRWLVTELLQKYG